MKRCIQTILVIAALSGCGKKDVTLLNQVPVKPIVNPATGVLIVNNNLLYASLESNTVISGATENNTFRTQDLFDHFVYKANDPKMLAPYTWFDKQDIINVNNTQMPVALQYTRDNGTKWNELTPVIDGETYTGYFSWQITGLQIKDAANNIMLLTTKLSTTNVAGQTAFQGGLYKIDVNTGKAVLQYQKQGWFFESMHFVSPDTGFMILDTLIQQPNGGYSNRNCWFSRTTDGGVTWTAPLLVDGLEPFTLVGRNDGYLVLYNGYGHSYVSSDGGLHWKAVGIESFYKSMFAAGGGKFYALGNRGLVHSSDGGNTWNLVTDLKGDNIYFQDDLHGLLYTNNTLYLTSDGGAHWKTLLYPYDYVTQ